ncbi:MAG: hypothetical protein MJZ81_07320 [Bacteroidales bacterium]|nr:hypothetical protein [Bacteroidales bacterium]
MVDISTAGTTIEIDKIGTISRFSDQGDPWTVEQIEVTGYGITINNELLVWSKPNAFVVSVNILSGTPEFNKLVTLVKNSRVKGKGSSASSPGSAANVGHLKIHLKSGSTSSDVTFKNGRLVKGPVAGSSSSDGRTTAQPAMFVFEDMA